MICSAMQQSCKQPLMAGRAPQPRREASSFSWWNGRVPARLPSTPPAERDWPRSAASLRRRWPPAAPHSKQPGNNRRSSLPTVFRPFHAILPVYLVRHGRALNGAGPPRWQRHGRRRMAHLSCPLPCLIAVLLQSVQPAGPDPLLVGTSALTLPACPHRPTAGACRPPC